MKSKDFVGLELMDLGILPMICLIAAILFGSCCIGHEHAHKLGDKAAVKDSAYVHFLSSQTFYILPFLQA
jgi:hypothetical protein